MAETPPPSGGRTATDFRDIADALRSRVDLFGKTLAGIASLGTTAVGLSEIGDLFPADDSEGWAIAACVALGVAALAAIGVAVRLMRVARPVFVSPDLEGNEELGGGERKAVRPVFTAAAERFGYTSLVGLQERERSLRAAASRSVDEQERARRTALADEVKTEIEQALARGQVVVVRRRASKAVGGVGAIGLYFLVITGLILFAAATDKVSSDRTDPIAEAKACGEARKAGATDTELGRAANICEGKGEKEKEEEPADPPSAPEARADLAKQLSAVLAACSALVAVEDDPESGPLDNAACDPVRRAVSQMDAAP
ncbi:MAG TPA: hypothetical protein VF529_04785 [Solirubrobacteraceae bacterium]|jgi:hypothetical protein